jgi:hypothetical protein
MNEQRRRDLISELFIAASFLLFVVTYFFPATDYMQIYMTRYQVHFFIIRFGSLTLLIVGILGRLSPLRGEHEPYIPRDRDPFLYRSNAAPRLLFIALGFAIASVVFTLIYFSGRF